MYKLYFFLLQNCFFIWYICALLLKSIQEMLFPLTGLQYIKELCVPQYRTVEIEVATKYVNIMVLCCKIDAYHY